MRRFSIGTTPYREMSVSALANIAREFENRGFVEDEEEDSDNGTATAGTTGEITISVI